jgi:hypothetical protein
MSKTDALAGRIDQLEAEYRSKLVEALRECAAGRWGLFGHNEHISPRAKVPDVAEELSDLGRIIDATRERVGLGPFPLHEQFRTSRGAVSANSIGEPKQAKLGSAAGRGEHKPCIVPSPSSAERRAHMGGGRGGGRNPQPHYSAIKSITCGGRGGIRTHGGLAPTAVFKTAALNHSATRPGGGV